jgi:hypothetical protein
MPDRIYRIIVSLGVLGIWILVLQNTGLIPRLRPDSVSFPEPVEVSGEVKVSDPVEVSGTVDISSVADTVTVDCENCEHY